MCYLNVKRIHPNVGTLSLLRNYKPEIVYQSLKRKPQNCIRAFEWKLFCDSCLRMLKVLKFQKLLVNWIHPGIELTTSLTVAVNSSFEVSIGSSTLVDEDSNANLFTKILSPNSVGPKFPKNALKGDLSPHSNTFPSVSTFFTSSIKSTMKKLQTFERVSEEKIIVFDRCIITLSVWKFQNVITSDLSRNSIWFFPVTTSLTSSSKVCIESLHLWKLFRLRKPLVVFAW